MVLKPTVRIEADLVVNDREAEILTRLTNRRVAEYLTEMYPGEFTREEIVDGLCSLREQCLLIVQARKAALAAITAHANGSV